MDDQPVAVGEALDHGLAPAEIPFLDVEDGRFWAARCGGDWSPGRGAQGGAAHRPPYRLPRPRGLLPSLRALALLPVPLGASGLTPCGLATDRMPMPPGYALTLPVPPRLALGTCAMLTSVYP